MKTHCATVEATLADVITETAAAFRYNPQDIVGFDQSRRVTHARHIAMFVSRVKTESSFQVIGRAFGERDPGTAKNGVEKIAGLLDDGDEQTQLDVLLVGKRLQRLDRDRAASRTLTRMEL